MEDLLLLLLYITLFTIFFYIITKHLFDRRVQQNNLPPSPFPTIPILGHLHLFRPPVHRSLAQVSARNGPILHLRFGTRRVLLISSPGAAEECLHKNDAIFANRPTLSAGELFGYNFTALNWAPYGDLWRNLRRISSTEILSPHRLHLLAGIRADEVKSLLIRIHHHQHLGLGDVMNLNMQTLFFETVNNVMMRMIAGKRCYGESVETEEARRFNEISIDLKKLGDVLTIGDVFPALKCFDAGKEKKFRKVFGKIDKFYQDLVDQHRSRRMEEENSDSVDDSFIKVLLSLQQKDPQFYTDEIVKGLLLVLSVAGTETSAGTMEWALSLLLNHPSILKKAQSEIDQVVGKQRLINESDLCNLPYLHCIINETLRMYPLAPILIHSSSGDCIIGGYNIPSDTMLFVNLWAIQNDPKLWDEPRKFNPERFEGVEGQKMGYKSMPFGSGRRACPGEALAMKMVGLVLGSILQCFDWERVGEGLVDMKENTGITMPRADALFANCRPREDMDMVKLLL